MFLGFDVGKGEHHAVALDRDDEQLLNRVLPNDETELRDLLAGLTRHGNLLLAVDQPVIIGAVGATVRYLRSLAIRRIADLHAGKVMTDARDALLIANTARTMPHMLHAIDVVYEQTAKLSMLCDFDEVLAG